MKATLLQLEALETSIEERLSAPATPCVSCADWVVPTSTARDRLDSLASSSPVLSRLAGAVRSSPASRGRSLFGEKARRSSPTRGAADCTGDGQTDGGSGPLVALGLDSTGGLFRVRLHRLVQPEKNRSEVVMVVSAIRSPG